MTGSKRLHRQVPKDLQKELGDGQERLQDEQEAQ
jgi:hypothetical protein